MSCKYRLVKNTHFQIFLCTDRAEAQPVIKRFVVSHAVGLLCRGSDSLKQREIRGAECVVGGGVVCFVAFLHHLLNSCCNPASCHPLPQLHKKQFQFCFMSTEPSTVGPPALQVPPWRGRWSVSALECRGACTWASCFQEVHRQEHCPGARCCPFPKASPAGPQRGNSRSLSTVPGSFATLRNCVPLTWGEQTQDSLGCQQFLSTKQPN